VSGANSWTGGRPPDVKTFEIRVDGELKVRLPARGASADFFNAEAKAGRYPAECSVGGRRFRNHHKKPAPAPGCVSCADALARHLHESARVAGACLEDTWDEEDGDVQEPFCTEAIAAISWLGRCRCGVVAGAHHAP